MLPWKLVRKETFRSVPAWCPQEGRWKENSEGRKEGGRESEKGGKRKVVMWVIPVHGNYRLFFFGPCVSIDTYQSSKINQCNWRTAVYHCSFNLYLSHQHWTSSHILLMYYLWQDYSCLLLILSIWFFVISLLIDFSNVLAILLFSN